MERRTNMCKIIVSASNCQGQVSCRIDKYLSLDDKVPLSRTALTQLFTENKVTVQGNPVKKSYKVTAGQEIYVDIPEIKEKNLGPSATDIPLNIVYEDEHLAVLNKQYGIAVHPGEGEENNQTLVSALLYHFGKNLSDGEDQGRPGIVHRLDKDTSGLMVICKTNEAHVLMKQKFHERSDDILKIYHTIVVGNLSHDHNVIKNCIMRHPKMRYKMMVTADKTQGKESITEYDVLKRWRVKNLEYTLLKITLHTGRTHQIRVTMASLARPVVGDPLYHKKNAKHKVDNLCLVSKELSFKHPILIDTSTQGPKELSLTSPYPQHMQDFMDYLDRNNEKTDESDDFSF
jgi:23S rRNA pseudouridine1911/1915/1917 synthase